MTDQIQQLLDRKGCRVETVPEDATVCRAVDLMNMHQIGSLLVGEVDRPVGIFTERDVLVRVVAQHLDPTTTFVRDVMTRDLVTVTPWTTVTAAMKIVTERRCRHLPVTDGTTICGLISSGDLTSWVVRDQRQLIDDLHGYIRAS